MKQNAIALLQQTRAAGVPIEAAFLTKAKPANRHQRRQAAASARKAGR